MSGKLLFGADPECAALDYDGNAVPPYCFRELWGVPSTDDPKHPIFLQDSWWKAHEDGANFEFALRPSHNPMDLFEEIQFVRNEVETKILAQFPQYVQPKLAFLPTVPFNVAHWEQLIQEGIIDRELFNMSTRFGCDPDQDVFNLQAQCQVIDVAEHPWRYCGGHIHISGSEEIVNRPFDAVKCMVVTAGIAATAFSPVPQLEYDRTFYYGRPGKFRVQHYGENPFGNAYRVGIEYRTVSATWAGNLEVAKQVLKWAEIGIKNLLENWKLGEIIVNKYTNDAIPAILQANQNLARQILVEIETQL